MGARFLPGSLRARFALIVLLAVLPILAASTLMQVYQRAAALEDFVGDTRRTTRTAAADLDRILLNSAQLLALLDPLQETHGDARACRDLLRHLLAAHPFLNDLAVLRPDGTVACSAQDSLGDLPAFTLGDASASASNFAIIGSRPEGASAQRELLLAYRPAGRQPNAPTYVASFGLAWIGRLVDASSLAGGSLATVIDDDGTVLYRSAQPERYVGRRISPENLLRIRHSDERWNNDTAGLDGVVRRYVAAEWGSSGGHLLLLAIGSPTTHVLQPYNRILFLQLLFLGGAALVALVAVQRTARALVLGPIDALVRAADQVGQGELSTHVEPRGSTEIRTLGATFNRAVDAIRHHQELEDRLRHAQRLQAVGQLAGGVAHEFNNMLTVIMGYAEGLLMEQPGREELEAIRDSAQRASRLTHQLLAFGRKQVLQPQRVSLNALVHDALGGMAPMLRPRIVLEEQLSPDAPEVRVDRQQFEHVFLNVLLNAREAMPDGGHLTVVTSRETLDPADGDGCAPGEYGVLRVTDTGSGMDAATLARALEPFFTTKPFGQSAGLGLSTAYGIVRQSGGQFLLTSEPGRGTTVTIFLPVNRPGREEA